LKDLEKTLRNIEEARPFEDLTVVCCFDGAIDGYGLMEMIRTTLLLQDQISISAPSSSSRGTAGMGPRVTRQVHWMCIRS
jgi:hypothetical protein